MDPQRERIQEDLRGLVAGDVLCDDLFVQMYASDASIYEIRPLGVVRPRHTRDVVACVQYARENQIPIHARGAGTGLAGESLGRGLVLDFSCYMRRIIRVDEDRVRVQPGVVHALLNQQLARYRKIFGPDPAMSHVTTIGGVIAVDGSGSHWLQYGSARRQVESLEVVLADGTRMEVGNESLADLERDENPRRREIVGQLASLLRNEEDSIERLRPKSLVNRAGYVLHDVLNGSHLNLARLLTGSEGTLALVTEATLRIAPLMPRRGVALFLFSTLEKAARAALEVRALGVTACDLMDRRHLSLARESDVRYDLLVPPEAEAVLLVEKQGHTTEELRDGLARIVQRIERRLKLASGNHQTFDEEEIELYWQLARRFVPTLYRLKGSTRPVPFVEDIAIPPEALPDFLVRLQNVLKRHQVIASLFGHVGHGQLHIRPFLDLANPEDVARMQSLAEDLYQEVWSVRGTISGEHGLGYSRTPFLAAQSGRLLDVFREVKRIFDPAEIFNPRKVVSNDPQTIGEPGAITANLRRTATAPETETSRPAPAEGNPAALVELQLVWQPDEMNLAARECNGCGSCRSQLANVRMCPILRVSPREEASPRAKANLVRAVLTGALSLSAIDRDDFKEVADLCVHCHQCRLECPATVDIPKLMVEAKGLFVRTNGLRPSQWFMSRIDKLSQLAARVPRVANWAISNRTARWLLEKSIGIAQGRKLPRLAPRTFMRTAHRRRLTRPTRRSGPKILYFVDTYANYHDPTLAEALVAVFEHNGIVVYVDPRQGPAGMPLISSGAIEPASRLAARNVAILAEAARQGYHIIASEPSAALCLTHEYSNLLADDDARIVAQNTSEACHFLWNLHLQGKLQLDFRPLPASLGYHLPCHLKALGIGAPGENLLRLIPGLTVRRIEKGCSGMAGTYGLLRKNYRGSLRAGWGLISAVRDGPSLAGVTECSTCKMQMEQATTKPTIHPLKLLALAYGLMPDLNRLLSTPGEDLIVT